MALLVGGTHTPVDAFDAIVLSTGTGPISLR
jgi:hypothetical protein